MHTIHLHGLRFHSFHGLHPGESLTGNEFEVSVDIEFAQINSIQSIQETVNYETVYGIIKAEMEKPHQLLETLADKIATDIHSANQTITRINIQLFKLNPPIENFTGRVGLTLNKLFS